MAIELSRSRIDQSKTVTSKRWLLIALISLFFLSGISGLIYQVLWLRQLSFVFGVTVYAASTVLASFMAGLALGSFFAGRSVDRARNPLMWYAAAEVLVGLSALATPFALDALAHLYAGLYPALGESLAWLTVIRFVFSFAVLLIPTTLMGATLPIIIKSSLVEDESLGAKVSLLYATNTAGAIVGTVLAGFYLIGTFGMMSSFYIAAALNILVGIAAAIVSLRLKPVESQVDAEPLSAEQAIEAAVSTEEPLSERTRKLVLVVFALSGFVSLALEVVWFRILALFLEATTYAFTVMLAAVLCGIAIGSYVATPLMKHKIDPVKLLAIIEMAIAVIAVASLFAIRVAYKLIGAADVTAAADLRVDFGLMIGISFFVVFPTMLLMGIAFPIGLRVWAAGTGKGTGRQVGVFYSVNVVGAVFGSIIAGFLLLPYLGSRASLIILASISLLSGLLLLAALAGSERRFKIRASAIAVTLFIVASILFPNPFSLFLKYRYPGDRILWIEEGAQTTVSIHQEPGGKRIMYLSGLHQANDTRAMVRSHRLIGHLPMLLHPNPKDVLVVGLGGGVTAGAASEHPGVEVDVIELSSSVAKGADWFSHVNSNVMHRPNVHLRVDDGRNYMMLTPRRYDVITADLMQSVHAGAGSLYSVEYFRLAYNVLKDDGIIIQWNSVKSETRYKLIMRTFMSVFPHTTLWAKGKLMIGSKKPLQLDPAEIDRRLQDAALRESLRLLRVEDFNSLASYFVAGPEQLRQYAGDGPVLTDDHPMVEYFLSLSGNTRKVRMKKLKGDVMQIVKPATNISSNEGNN